MRTMYRYHFSVGENDPWRRYMPEGAIFRAVAPTASPDMIDTWFEIPDEKAGTELRRFQIVGTGHELPDNYHYLGTASYKPQEIGLVWHLFEETSQ